MNRLTASFVLGYHGCDESIAEELLSGTPFEPSQNPYDWLGGGIYFWEANPKRGLDFITKMQTLGIKAVANPTVIGAVIDLGHCLDLMTATGIGMVEASYESLRAITSAAKGTMPANQNKVLRQLDCAVIEHLHSIIAADDDYDDFDTVRAVFTEGRPIYPGAGFDAETHIWSCPR